MDLNKIKHKKNINGLSATQVVFGDDSDEKSGKGSSIKKNHLYYITLTEMLHKIRKNGTNLTDSDKAVTFTADMISVGKSCAKICTIKDIKVKYIACSVSKHYEFDKLKKRVKVEKDDENPGNLIYYIPIHFIRSLVPEKISRDENISGEILDIGIFKYTGEIEQFLCLSVFNLADEVFISKKINQKGRNLRVIM